MIDPGRQDGWREPIFTSVNPLLLVVSFYIKFVSLSILLDQRMRYGAAGLEIRPVRLVRSDGRLSDGKILSDFPQVP